MKVIKVRTRGMELRLHNQSTEIVRCGIYARSASAGSDSNQSIKEQIRVCKKHADEKGWLVIEDFIRADIGVSGASLSDREALHSLLLAAKQTPRQFDCVMVNESSHLCRNLGDLLKLCESLKRLGIFLCVVEPKLDSRDRSFRSLLIFGGMLDEQYQGALCQKIRRGQKGRALSGFHTGGRCYGYRGVPVLRDGNHSSEAIGVRLEIVANEADIVRQIFRMRASGYSANSIAKSLTGSRVPSPFATADRERTKPWRSSAVRTILKNAKYRGTITWNRTRRITNPDGRAEVTPRPESEWIRVAAPELRIVSDDDWYKAQGFSFRGLLACRNCRTGIKGDRRK